MMLSTTWCQPRTRLLTWCLAGEACTAPPCYTVKAPGRGYGLQHPRAPVLWSCRERSGGRAPQYAQAAPAGGPGHGRPGRTQPGSERYRRTYSAVCAVRHAASIATYAWSSRRPRRTSSAPAAQGVRCWWELCQPSPSLSPGREAGEARGCSNRCLHRAVIAGRVQGGRRTVHPVVQGRGEVQVHHTYGVRRAEDPGDSLKVSRSRMPSIQLYYASLAADKSRTAAEERTTQTGRCQGSLGHAPVVRQTQAAGSLSPRWLCGTLYSQMPEALTLRFAIRLIQGANAWYQLDLRASTFAAKAVMRCPAF
jgi:hypothetical protein